MKVKDSTIRKITNNGIFTKEEIEFINNIYPYAEYNKEEKIIEVDYPEDYKDIYYIAEEIAKVFPEEIYEINVLPEPGDFKDEIEIYRKRYKGEEEPETVKAIITFPDFKRIKN